MSIENRLNELNIVIPKAPQVAANYVPVVRHGNLLYISGQVTATENGLQYVGKVGKEYSAEEGYAAARICALNCLAQAKATIGTLENVQQIIRVGGFVNCTDDFKAHPQVINGASDLLVEIFGDKGQHARAAIGCASLPLGVATEVEMLIAVAP